MKTQLLTMASGLAAWAGMAVLCFRSSSQRRRLGLRQQTWVEQWRYTVGALVLLVLSLVAAVSADGARFGVLLWLCQAGLLSLTLICALPFARGFLTASAWVAALLALLAFALATVSG